VPRIRRTKKNVLNPKRYVETQIVVEKGIQQKNAGKKVVVKKDRVHISGNKPMQPKTHLMKMTMLSNPSKYQPTSHRTLIISF
jgi:hypothetical protein